MNQTELTLGLLNGSECNVAVHVLRTRDSGKVERMRQEAKVTPREDPDEQLLLEVFYPILFYCTEGDVPTKDEFLDMPMVEANNWFDAVDKLNPGLLPQPEEKETVEKKES